MKKVDYAGLPTEKPHPKSAKIDLLSTDEIIMLINSEDLNVPRSVGKVRHKIGESVEMIVSALRNKGRLFFAGAGTSGRLGVIEAAECPPTFGTPSSLVQAVIAGGKQAVFRSQEGAEDDAGSAFKIFRKKLRHGDVLVGIAASGITPFVRGALKAARTKRARTILISCNSTTPMKNLADCVIAPKIGPEVISGSTRLKAGTATKLILNMLTAASMIRLGKVYQNWMVDVQPKSRKLVARALCLIQKIGNVSDVEAKKYMIRAHMNVKLAILMAKMGYTYQESRSKLKKASGFLRRALGK
ncbi:MAG: N-acetylmuramic acid 6-phosphate etherase [Candidatus Omnitrophica bacterium]|nr:N-acetylmuramic acid 6-phosphate etherase [Candidatus Omnitrophota bacterium]